MDQNKIKWQKGTTNNQNKIKWLKGTSYFDPFVVPFSHFILF
jgi:hypothetical protein